MIPIYEVKKDISLAKAVAEVDGITSSHSVATFEKNSNYSALEKKRMRSGE